MTSPLNPARSLLCQYKFYLKKMLLLEMVVLTFHSNFGGSCYSKYKVDIWRVGDTIFNRNFIHMLLKDLLPSGSAFKKINGLHFVQWNSYKAIELSSSSCVKIEYIKLWSRLRGVGGQGVQLYQLLSWKGPSSGADFLSICIHMEYRGSIP